MPELTLLQFAEAALGELQQINGRLDQIMLQQREQLEILHGFTSGGSSFHAYQLDPLAQAYIALLASALGDQLQQATKDMPLTELVKAAIPLSRTLLEELDAYRSARGGLDYLEEQIGFLQDPWSQEAAAPTEVQPDTEAA